MNEHGDPRGPRTEGVRDTPPPPGGAAMQDDSPFGTPGGGGARGRATRWAMRAGFPLAALVAVYLVTRGSERPTAMSDGHDHGAMLAADSARPVMLSAVDARRIGVTYAVASRGTLTREIRMLGQVTFDETRVKAIAPRVDGWVERLHVDFTGQEVRVGEPLLELYSPMLVTAQEELLLARRLQREMAGSPEEARGSAAELLASARRRLAHWDVAESDVARIESAAQVERTFTLRSPVGGFVIEKNVLEGQKIVAGEPLYRIADLGTVWVEGEVFEQDYPLVRLGEQVTAELDAFPGERWTGRITYVYPTVDPETRTARVRVALPNPGHRLKPGMYAILRLAAAGSRDVLSVPRSAVLSTGERHLIFVRRADGMLEPRLVEPGVATDDRIEILRGLAAGDTVVASATFLVDAESNLGTALGGMGNMPGMDMTAPRPADADSGHRGAGAGHADHGGGGARGTGTPAGSPHDGHGR